MVGREEGRGEILRWERGHGGIKFREVVDVARSVGRNIERFFPQEQVSITARASQWIGAFPAFISPGNSTCITGQAPVPGL